GAELSRLSLPLLSQLALCLLEAQELLELLELLELAELAQLFRIGLRRRRRRRPRGGELRAGTIRIGRDDVGHDLGFTGGSTVPVLSGVSVRSLLHHVTHDAGSPTIRVRLDRVLRRGAVKVGPMTMPVCTPRMLRSGSTEDRWSFPRRTWETKVPHAAGGLRRRNEVSRSGCGTRVFALVSSCLPSTPRACCAGAFCRCGTRAASGHQPREEATMAKPDKVAAVAEIADKFRNSSAAVVTQYSGLSVSQLNELRRALGNTAKYRVAKNTLVKRAAAEAGVEGIDELFVGPTAIAFVEGEPVEAAKVLRDFAKDNSALVIKGGYMDGAPLSVSEIEKIADLESREVLLAKAAGAMKAKLSQAAALFQAPASKVARLSAALEEKRKSEGGAEPAAES